MCEFSNNACYCLFLYNLFFNLPNKFVGYIHIGKYTIDNLFWFGMDFSGPVASCIVLCGPV